jgi:hypothetical protein
MKKNLAIVILTWNDYKNTIICLQSILGQLKSDQKIFLVDNNSEKFFFQKTFNWLNKKYKKKLNKTIIKKNHIIPNSVIKKKSIFIIKNKKNLGCGVGHNSGYRLAITNRFKFIARIDNDMLVPNKFFSKILRNFKNQNVEAVSPKILYKKNRKLIWWMGAKIGHSLKFDNHMRDYPHGLKDNKKYSGIVETDAVAGCASIMRCSRLKKVGLSDKDFFYGPEDVEFSKRIFKKNCSLIVDRDSKIFHSVTQSFVNLNKRKIYFEYKYRLVLISKIGSFSDKLFGYSVSMIKSLLYLLFFFKKKHRFKIFPIFLAWKHFYQNKLGEFDRNNKKVI